MKRRRLTPWQKIIRAGLKSHGLRLTPEEVGRLWMDDAIKTKAENDDEDQHQNPNWTDRKGGA